jgi:hypothetical protein
MAASLADFVGNRQTRLITFTLKSSQEPLLELVDKLLLSFRNMRRNRLWRNTQAGGAAFLEVKWNTTTNRWHPHLHVISEGRYLAKRDLRRIWYSITKDSFIVDIRLITGREGVCAYVTKHVASPVTHSVTNSHELLIESMRALHGRRTATTYGTWRGVKLVDKPESDDWTYYGSWKDLKERAEYFPWGEERRVLAGILAGTADQPPKQEYTHPPHPPPMVFGT